MYVCMYIYIYIYTYMCICIHISVCDAPRQITGLIRRKLQGAGKTTVRSLRVDAVVALHARMSSRTHVRQLKRGRASAV